jgi:hypothetical protein
MTSPKTLVLAVALVVAGGWSLQQVTGRETVVGLPCDGCEGVFDNMPSALNSAARDTTGTWLVTRDIVLGRAIPGYPR